MSKQVPSPNKHNTSESKSNASVTQPSGFRSKKYFWVRLALLLIVMGGLSSYAWRIYNHRKLLAGIAEAMQQYKDEAAIEQLHNMEQKYGRTGELEFLQARAYRHLDDMEKTNNHLDSATRLGYDPKLIQRERILGDLQSGRLDTVGDIQQFLADGAVDFDETATAICYAFILNSRFDDAEKILPIWKQMSPKSDRPYYIGALSAQHYQKWEDAMKLLDECLKRAPDSQAALLRMGESKLKLNRQAEAEPIYKKILEKSPDNVEAKIGLAQAMLGSQHAEEAVQFMRGERERGEKDFEFLMLLGRTELTTSDAKKAIEVLLPLYQLWPKDVEVNYSLSQAYAQAGDDSKSEKHQAASEEGRKLLSSIDKMIVATEQRPKDADLRQQIGTILLHYQSREDGRFWLESALRINPDHKLAQQELAIYRDRVDVASRRSQRGK